MADLKITSRLSELIEQGISEGAFPGLNLVIVNDMGRVTASYGKKALFPKFEGNSVDTIYDMASVSKVVSTTTAILLLLEEGYLRLYDSVSKYLPLFRHKDICVIDLITHTSGLQSDLPKAASIKSRKDALEMIYNCDPVYEKGSKIVYSDVGFILLGFIIESIAKTGLDVFTKSKIFLPLEMKDTGYNPEDKIRCAPTEERRDTIFDGIVRGHVHDEKAYILGGVAGHAGLFSTVSDLGNFIKMVLDEGKYKNNQFMSKACINMLFRPRMAVFETNKIDEIPLQRRSVGWICDENNSNGGDFISPLTITHTGFTGTNIVIDKGNRIGFSLLSNRVHPTRDNLKHMSYRSKIGNYIISHYGLGAKNDI